MTNPNSREEAGFSFKNFNTMGNNWLQYDGEFLDGKMHGLGALTLTNKQRFVGKFKNGKANGTGTFQKSDGTTVSGEWENNQLINVF